MSNPIPPEQDIGPFFKAAGFLALIALIVITVFQTTHNHLVDKFDIFRDGLIILLILGLWRPKFVDDISKTIADKLPFFKFTKQ